jgi:hypothetical protein
MGTATFVAVREGFKGRAALYRLDPPLLALAKDAQPWEWVVVSSTEEGGTKTSILPANDQGQVMSWRPLPGSSEGATLHEEVLALAGYDVVMPPEPQPVTTEEVAAVEEAEEEPEAKVVDTTPDLDEDPQAFWERMAKALEE